MDRRGRWAVRPQYLDVNFFSEGFAVVGGWQQWDFIPR
ncbi:MULTISPECIES: WG repeat-containing protein [unclassified Microcoleus]